MTFEFIMAISFALSTTVLAIIVFLQQRLILVLDKKIIALDEHLIFHGQKIGQIENNVQTRVENAIAAARTVAEQTATSIVRKEIKAVR